MTQTQEIGQRLATMDETRTCTQCRQPKTLDQFGSAGRKWAALHPHCRACRSAYNAGKVAARRREVRQQRNAAKAENRTGA